MKYNKMVQFLKMNDVFGSTYKTENRRVYKTIGR